MLRLAFLTALLASTVLASAHAADTTSLASDQLASQARYWEGQNRYDLARENWLKLLRGSPDNPSALAGLANAEAISGRAAAAQVYLDRLKEAHPDHPDIRRLQALIRQGNFNQDKLTQPRLLARQGKYQEAVDAYKAAFGKDIPGGRLGLEYYQTLAGAEGGWEPAKAGIEKLAQDNFDDPIYKLALAQHLTYRESTRRDGIASLSKLAQDSAIGAPARQAWRQALIWLAAKSGDEPLYQDYLKRFGDDAQVAARLASLKAPAPAPMAATAVVENAAPALPPEPTADELRGKLVKAGFDALNNNQLDIASDAFINAMSQYGESADTLGGLGIVRLRQQAYPEARDLLERAIAKDKKRAARWSEALGTARFWQTVREAEAARKANDNATAIRELRRAISSDPKRAAEELTVPISLADVLVEDGQYQEAEKIYRDVIRRNPDNSDALRGLVGVLTRTKRLPEAIALAEHAPESVRSQMGNFGVLKAQNLREQAADAARAKDDLRAESLLKDALLVDPESPWTRLDLARIYQRQNRIREANTLVDGLLGPGTAAVQPDAIYIKASLLAEQQDFLGGLQLLEQVPVGARTASMTDLQKRLWVRYQAQRAGVYSRSGQPQQALQILSEVEPFVGEMPELLGAMANAYADLGDETNALRYMRQALTRNTQSDVGLRLAYAGLLFKLRQDTEFEVVMEDLLHRGKLTEQQSLDLANLRIGYRLRQADLVREEGDLARAYEYLQPLIRVNPNDPRLMMALARLYNDSKDFDKAYTIYQRVLAQNANEMDAYKGAIGAALAMQHYEDADALLERAFALDPNNPRLYALAGRSAKGRGDDGRALGLFQQALRLDAEQNNAASGVNGGATVNGSGNSQPLLQLIDPSTSYMRPPSRVVGSVEPPLRREGNSRFFDVRANLALRPVAKKMVAVPAARPVFASAHTIRPVRKGERLLPTQWAPSRQQRLVGDYCLPTRASHFLRRPGFIRVSTPPRGNASDPAQGTIDQPSGYWSEQPRAPGATSYKYVESLKLPTATQSTAPQQPYGYVAPAPQQPAYPSTGSYDYGASRTEFPAPRRVNPSMSPRLSRPNGSLREELIGDIEEINGRTASNQSAQQGVPAGAAYPPMGQPAPTTYPRTNGGGVYEVPRLDDGYGAYAPQPATPYYAAPQITTPYYNVPAPAPPVPVYTAPPPPAPVYVQPAAVIPPPPPSMIRTVPNAPVISSDPMLATPEFVLNRNVTDTQDRRDLLKEIGDLRAQRSPYAAAGLALRSRDGVQGLNRLYDIESPVEVGLPAMDAGRFKLRVVPVYLDAGVVSGSNLPLYGATGLALALGKGSPNLRFDNTESGVAVGLGFEAGDFKADIGSSPLGFPIETIVGGINWRPKSERLSFKIDISRRSVTDSLLSYAGLRDPATGLKWGGVTKTGGRLDAAYDLGKYGLYGNASYHVLNGEYVPENSVIEVGGGIYARAFETRENRVTYGLNITSFAYDKNLRQFTFGHGGYFSPKSYLAVSIPVEWEGYRNRFSYKLGGALGLQSFSEDGAVLYPIDSGLQNALVTALTTYTGTPSIRAGYTGKHQSGVGFSFAGQFEYLLDPNLAMGARLSLDNATDYSEASAIGYLRYMFYPQKRVSFPPNTLLPYFNFGDPRL